MAKKRLGKFKFGDRPAMVNSLPTKQYKIWSRMMNGDQNKISENFKSYDYFYDWCLNQIGFSESGFGMTCEIISRDKFYSEDTCVFVPPEIMNQFAGGKTINNELPKGVTVRAHLKCGETSYKARITKKGCLYHIGIYRSVDAALKAYESEKSQYLRELAEHHKESIDHRAYQALINY